MDQQQRRDDVSAKLGSLLLKGYKMLADSCPKCSNVLMQDKKGVVTCVNCKSDEDLIPNPVSGTTAHQLPQHGYSEGFPYRRPNEGITPEAAYYAEGILLTEIKAMALHMERNEIDNLIIDARGMLKDRGAIVEYIQKCAETVKSLQGIRK